MDPAWTTTVLLVPCVIVLTAGFFYLYSAVISLLSKTSVRNKVVVITDSLSGLGKGNRSIAELLKTKPNILVMKSILQLFLCLVFNVVFSLSTKNVQVCFTKGGRGWSSVGKVGRNLKNLQMIWQTPQTQLWYVSPRWNRKDVNDSFVPDLMGW